MKKREAGSVTCPRCGEAGKSVKEITLRSLVREGLRGPLDGREWRFCQTPNCDAVYFDEAGETVFVKDDLTVRVGIKETEAPRPICYCFDHTVEEINEEVTRTGTTTVLDDIKTRMKKACWCETTSPMGSCCLATVTRFVKAAQADAGLGTPSDEEPTEGNCCASHEATHPEPEARTDKPERQRLGILASGGAVLSAALSSACCWLPLLLIAFGASAAGVAGLFEAWRPWFLGGAALFLGLGFYLAYFRKQDCDPGGACAVPNPNPKLQRFNRAMLWVAAVFVAAFALFPNYLGVILGAGEESSSPTAIGAMADDRGAIVLPVAGMTCEACAVSLQKNLAAVTGVARAAVDYEDGKAVVVPAGDDTVSRAALVEAVERSGYRVEAIRL